MKRRDALKTGIYGAAFLGLTTEGSPVSLKPLPPGALFERDPEAYWERIRKEQFLLPSWRAFLNTGSLGIAPKPVVGAVVDYLNRSASLVGDEYPRWGYETLDETRAELAEFFGCEKDELALTHNATEAMNTIANGLDLQPGDEVVMTDQEHPGGSCCWLQKQSRFGIKVKEVADLMVSAIRPRTKVISFSGITTTTGLILPIKLICEAARAKGVISVVDGAHVNGQIAVNLHSLGCDFYAGSPHKWMFTPAGCGMLYGRGDMLDRLWVNVATSNWDKKEMKAARFMMVGTNNLALFKGYTAGLRFLKEIGPERVYSRIHQLARNVVERAATLPNVEMLTPNDDRMFGGMVSFKFNGVDLSPVLDLCKQRRIWVILGERSRISTHIHTRPSDLDILFETIREGLKQKQVHV
jgi:selenocysteine lyase/cysteine desulfurase